MRVGVVVMSRYETDPRVRREVAALTAAGDDVEVFALGADHPPYVDGAVITTVAVEKYRGANAGAYLRAYARFVLAALVRLSVAHVRRPFDVVVVHTMPDFLVFAALLPKLTGARVILDVHDLMPELYATKFGVSVRHPLVRAVRLAERASIGFADRAFAVHEYHLDALVGHGNPRGKFDVLHNLPDPSVFPPGIAQVRERTACARFVYHGTVERRHGLEVALRAVAECRARGNPVELAILGDGSDVPRLRRLAGELGVADLVDINGAMAPIDEIVPSILEADVGVVPVVVDEFTEYMLPTKLLEYLQLGVPAIVTDLPAVRRFVGEGPVLYVPSGDVSALADAMMVLAGLPAERARLASAGLRFAADHDWERESKIFVDAVHETREGGAVSPPRHKERRP